MQSDSDYPDVVDASRRTLLAQERTYLAWFRSGMAALAVSIGVGGVLPAALDTEPVGFVALGLGYALLGFVLMVYGLVRHRAVQRALARGGFVSLPMPAVVGLTLFGCALAVATVIVLLR